MRIIQNRTGNILKRPLRILSILRGQWDEQRAPALQALADIGHEVVYVDEIMPLEGYRKLVQRLEFDVAVWWGSSLQNFLLSHDGEFFLDEAKIPYVSLWTDNPIKHLSLFENNQSPFHKGLFIADTHVISQMTELGWKDLFYLPPWHIDPEIFKPVAPVNNLACDVSFAATINSYDAEKDKWRGGWSDKMQAAGDSIIGKSQESRDHVDVYDTISQDWDVASPEFSRISHAMYFEQKALARQQLIEAVGGQELHIIGIGTATTNRKNIIMHEGREWHELSPVFCSSALNLNLTPWPNSCHHRLFQIAASGALPVSDWREDAVSLFEPDVEAVYFKSLDEIPDLINRLMDNPEERNKIASAARRRFLSEHTAAHRMAELSAHLYDLL